MAYMDNNDRHPIMITALPLQHVPGHKTRFTAEFTADIPEQFTPIGVLEIRNKCCPGRPVILTRNDYHGCDNYSAQCACGRWVTTGCGSSGAAVLEWERMTNDGPGFVKSARDGIEVLE